MNVAIVTRPTSEPVSVAEAKDHLYIDGSDNDSMIAGIVSTARAKMEGWTRRQIMTATWDYCLDRFPVQNFIVLPFGNLQTVTSVKYKDVYGVESTMVAVTGYLVETNGEGHGRIVLPYGCTWPSGDFYPSNPITIRFVCGWTSAALVPFTIKHGIKLLCSEMYEARGEPVIGSTVVESHAAENLIASERLWGNF